MAGVDAFGILVAELLLKQTKAEMVAEIWPVLMRQYPSARQLSIADPRELFSIIEKLGLGQQRVKALVEVSSAICRQRNIPSEVSELFQLPFVGLYSAHAVASFAFRRRVPVVDVNVIRILSRLCGILPQSDIRKAKAYWDLARSLLPVRRFVEHNYGMLDFAATVCRSKAPSHDNCPLAHQCSYSQGVERM